MQRNLEMVPEGHRGRAGGVRPEFDMVVSLETSDLSALGDKYAEIIIDDIVDEISDEIPIVKTVKAFSEGRVKIQDRTITDFNGTLINGYDLSPEIDRVIT